MTVVPASRNGHSIPQSGSISVTQNCTPVQTKYRHINRYYIPIHTFMYVHSGMSIHHYCCETHNPRGFILDTELSFLAVSTLHKPHNALAKGVTVSERRSYLLAEFGGVLCADHVRFHSCRPYIELVWLRQTNIECLPTLCRVLMNVLNVIP